MKILYNIFFLMVSVVSLKLISQITSTTGTQGRTYRIKPRPCKDPQGEPGICMFQWECRQRKGVMLSTCFDKFLFGTCCQLSKEEMEQTAASLQWASFNNVTSSGNKVKPTEAPIQVPQFPNLNSGTTVGNHNSVHNSTNNFVLSEETFSPPEPLTNDVLHLNAPNHSTPDVDKLFQQFLGSVLSNHSASEPFLSKPTLSAGSGVSPETTPSFATSITWPSTSLTSTTSSETAAVGAHIEDLHFLSTTTAASVPVIIETASGIGDYEDEYPLEEPEANVSTMVYEPISNDGTVADDSVSPILLGNTTTSSVTVVENQIIIGDHIPTGQLFHTANETFESEVTEYYDSEYVEEETTATITTTTATTSTTTTTTEPTTTTTATTTTTEPPTTTAKQYDYKRDCGVRPLMPNGRIVGGTNSKFGEWPWQVLIKEATWLGLFVKNKCGGVLLNKRYVITAAHCQPSFLASLLVVFGESDLSDRDEEFKSIQRNVKRVIVHRKFNALTFDNDLALLELERPIEYKPHIVPICLPPDNFEFMDKIAVVSGWGRLKYGGRLPTRLQQVEIPIIPNKKCQQMFLAAGHHKSITDKFLCAGYQEGVKDSCEGDSGGPLTVQGDDGRWILVGTVSHGIKCAYPNLPGVYMRISAYKSWILRVIGS